MTVTRSAARIDLVFEDPPRPATPDRLPGKPRQRRVPADYIAPPSHRPHGTYVKYVVEACRCEDCRAANRNYERERQRAIQRPDRVWMPYVPAGPARAHLAELAAAGVGIKTVAKITGLPHGGLSKLVYGDRSRGMTPSKRIRPATAAKILAVTVDQADGAQKIDATTTWRLLEDLISRGFTKTWIAGQLGQRGRGLQVRRGQVRASTARKVEDLHRGLQGVNPSDIGAARRSRWDDR